MLTKEKCPHCGSCGMPMTQVSERGGGNPEAEYCVHCSNDEGNLVLGFEDIVTYYTNDFIKRRGLNPEIARRLAGETVSKLPAWRENQ